jgi:branched-chain amino acid transport system ATP-binding protein
MDADILDRGQDVDVRLLESIARYIETFPDRIHHPKEEQYLFKAMRKRSPEAAAMLDGLYKEHQKENVMIRDYAAAVAAYERDGAKARAAMAVMARDYADFMENHIERENREAFPLAERILTEADWAAIDAAFLDNDDPMLGGPARAEFDALHRRIVALGLPPMGLPPDGAPHD